MSEVTFRADKCNKTTVVFSGNEDDRIYLMSVWNSFAALLVKFNGTIIWRYTRMTKERKVELRVLVQFTRRQKTFRDAVRYWHKGQLEILEQERNKNGRSPADNVRAA